MAKLDCGNYQKYRIWANSLEEAIAILKSPQQEIIEKVEYEAYTKLVESAMEYYDINMISLLVEKSLKNELKHIDDINISPYRLVMNERHNKMKDFLLGQEEMALKLNNYVYPIKFTDKFKNKNYYVVVCNTNTNLENYYLEKIENYPMDSNDKLKRIDKFWLKKEKDLSVCMSELFDPVKDNSAIVVNIAKYSQIDFFNNEEYDIDNIIREISFEKRLQRYMKDITLMELVNDIHNKNLPSSSFASTATARKAVDMYMDGNIPLEVENKVNEKKNDIKFILDSFDRKKLVTDLSESLEDLKIGLNYIKMNKDLSINETKTKKAKI